MYWSTGAKLRQTGRLLVYVPAFRLLWTGLDEKIRHHRRYRRKDLERLTRSAGLSVQKSRYVDSLGFLVALSSKIISRKKADLSARAIALYDRYIVPPNQGLRSLVR
jgi:hypothetical protein